MADQSNDRVGHFNTILARGGGNLNNPIFKSSNARALLGGGCSSLELIGALHSQHFSCSGGKQLGKCFLSAFFAGFNPV